MLKILTTIDLDWRDPYQNLCSTCIHVSVLLNASFLLVWTKGPLYHRPHLVGFYDTYIIVKRTIFRIECHLLDKNGCWMKLLFAI